MGVQWTKEQRQVIEMRDRNILVSAAAGSGKTAVLVERILERVTDPEHPVDIDRLLIMTFTRAAAGEMRTRLAGALEAKLEEHPEDERLARQAALLHNAQITTIHGFCAYVIQNYFHMVDLDPGYRVADQGECRLLMGDVAREVIEAGYEEKSPAYDRFVESYSAGKTDEGLEELLLQLYDFAMSHPWPEQSLDEWEAAYTLPEGDSAQTPPWLREIWDQAEKYLLEARKITERNLALALGPSGPYMYEKALLGDLELIDELLTLRAYDDMWQALEKPSFLRLSPVKDPLVSEVCREQIQEGRKQVKSLLAELGENFFPVSEEEVRATMADCRECIHVLVSLTKQFMETYAARKREKNILDFSDLEHFALEILLKKEGGEIKLTQAARELSLRYEEVMVDEYQDSNLVQEYLMNAVSGWAKQRDNLFMVGDVKQSIYRFRMARPELFMDKMKRYALASAAEDRKTGAHAEAGEAGAQKDTAEAEVRNPAETGVQEADVRDQRIDLHRNFRSRAQVLDSVNYLFFQIMREELGGVEYDQAAALNPGAVFPPKEREEFARTELMFVETGDEERMHTGMSERELEAMAIAGRIRQIVGKEQILDPASGTYRNVEYGDIVILLRTMEGWADTFAEVLASQGIPAYAVSKTGYFSAREVVTVLNFLRICDNPRQEIPYTAVLHSPLVGCGVQELAQIRVEIPETPVYQAVEAYAKQGSNAALRDKLKDFLGLLEEMRRKAAYVPIHAFILEVFEKTGYREYVSALPGGQGRAANLDMLVEKASAYEKTSYRGLFHFIRYIDSLQSYQVDFGEGSVTDGTNMVEIMSIHKSKGLEFPVVFVAGMGKNFNTQEQRSALVLHPELGIGADAVYPEYRSRIPTLLKQVIKMRVRDENLGEELRVLYVALTRAKEKLILTGTVKNMDKKIQGSLDLLTDPEERLSYMKLSKVRIYWDWILPAVLRHRDFAGILDAYGWVSNPSHPLYQSGPGMYMTVLHREDLVVQQVERQVTGAMAKERLQQIAGEQPKEPLLQELSRRFSYRYPYEDRREIPVKVSVSDLKHQRQDEDSYEYYFEPDVVPLIPRFMEAEQEAYIGAARGTVYHRVMECLDYGRLEEPEDIRRQLVQMEKDGRLDETMAACVQTGDIWNFAASPLGQRMKKAALQGCLFRERPFVLLRPASDLNRQWTDEEDVLIQGIIDAYFLEGEEIVLVDYKTDQVFPGREGELTERYQVQLRSYAQALRKLTGRKVKEIYIYSFTLGKALPVEDGPAEEQL